MIFATTRERRAKQQSGSFACTVCESEVLRWSDRYDFVGWLLVTKRPTRSERPSAMASG